MTKALVAVATVLLLVSADHAAVSADSGPTQDPQQELALINQIRGQLGSNLADALAAQVQLRQSLQDNAVQQQAVQTEISDANIKGRHGSRRSATSSASSRARCMSRRVRLC